MKYGDLAIAEHPECLEGGTDSADEMWERLPHEHGERFAPVAMDWQEQFEASESDPEKVAGDPESAMKHWEHQGDTRRCALYAQKFIIEQFTGRRMDINELVCAAKENGWFSETGGTSLLNMNRLLEHYGIDSDISQYNTIEDVEECLKNGGLVVAAVDSGEIWFGGQDELYVPDEGADHAVEVIGVDRSDPQNPMVIVNDSGSRNGRGAKIPLDTFLDAWEDSNFAMVAAHRPQLREKTGERRDFV